MTDMPSAAPTNFPARRFVPDLPLVIWMVILALALGFAGGLDAGEVIDSFNVGFGRALGEFALILLPSFILAAALTRRNIGTEAAGRTALLASPIAGAGMICPDTAYAALSPAAGRYKLDAAFGAYAGFKLLYPAGPLIVATGLGVTGGSATAPTLLLLCGALLTLPVWLAAVLWRRFAVGRTAASTSSSATGDAHLWATFAPFMLMAGLLSLGGFVDATGYAIMDFLFLPKGALMAAAALALLQTPSEARRDCLDSAVRRTGSLLLVIGAASAFGGILTGNVALDGLVPPDGGTLTLLALFVLTVLFKLAQGSSMATFAAVAPVAAPILITSGVNEIAAVFTICLGSFIAILPNDSYYWLVRRDALAHEQSERRAIGILMVGAVIQALVGMAILLAMMAVTPEWM